MLWNQIGSIQRGLARLSTNELACSRNESGSRLRRCVCSFLSFWRQLGDYAEHETLVDSVFCDSRPIGDPCLAVCCWTYLGALSRGGSTRWSLRNTTGDDGVVLCCYTTHGEN